MRDFFSRKSVVAASIVCAVLLFAFSGSHPTTGTGGYTGAPNDSVCTQCHTPGGNITGSIEISGLPSTVQPNTTYPLTVTIIDTSPGASASRTGFQMVSLKANLANGGTFSVPASENNATVKTVNGKSYVGHQPSKNFGSGTVVTFDVEWTAPTAATGPITVYGASILANGGNGNSQDRFVATNVSTELGAGGDPLTVTFTNIIDTQCSDSSDGSATANAAGGSGGYSYLWDNGESSATAIMLSAGDHSVTVTDNSNATVVGSVTIASPSALTVSIISQEDADCNGSNNGSAELTANGGTPGYFFDWGGGISGPIQNNLFAGNYTVTVTDLTGCEALVPVIISEPSPIILTLIQENQPSCFGDSDGSLTVIATGGTEPYTYTWLTNGLGNADGGTITDLPAGAYLVEVFDGNGCGNELEVGLSEPSELGGFIQETPISCSGGSDGTAEVQASGGTPGYSYLWSNGSTTALITDLEAGVYTVTITDASGCTIILEMDADEPISPVEVSIVIDELPNCGNNDGTISALGDGGTPDYSFEWNTGAFGSILTDIPSGTYTVTVTDANGCTSSTSDVLTDNEGISIAANDVTNNTCFGGTEGTATASASGGSGIYSYEWSTGAMTATVTDLAAGTYTVTVLDNNSCSGELTIEITEPPMIMDQGITTDPSCSGANNGSITIDPIGGTGDISIAWNVGSSDNTISDLPPGQYSVTLTDANDCVAVVSYVLTDPDPIVIDMVDSMNPLCPDDSTGMISITASGGTGTLSYAWSTGDTNPSISDLQQGDYDLTVTDENNCTAVFSYTLDDPSEIQLDINAVSPTCAGNEDGSISITATGGTAPYSYLWSTADSTSILNGLSAGSYDLTVTDANGCERQTTIILEDAEVLSITLSSMDVSTNGAMDGSASAAPTNGTAPYTFLWSTGAMTDTITDLSPGVYGVTVTDANGCTASEDVVINNGDCNIMADVAIDQISCFDLQDGQIALTISEAVAPITYEWSDGQITETAIDLGTGTYDVTITDANGCILQIVDIEITAPDEIQVTDVQIMDASSATAMDGSITIAVAGGTGTISYTYTDEAGNTLDFDDLTAVPPGTYFVVAADENGCEATFGPYTVGFITSVTEIDGISAIFPNPTQGMTIIETSTTLDAAPQIYNLQGQWIDLPMTVLGNRYEMDLSTLSNGIYLIKTSAGGKLTMNRILVNK